MMFNHLKTDSAKLAHYRFEIQKSSWVLDFQSLMQHPLFMKLLTEVLKFQFKVSVLLTSKFYSVPHLWIISFMALAFEGIQISYVVHILLLAMAIYSIACYYWNLITMATEACIYNFAVWRYT